LNLAYFSATLLAEGYVNVQMKKKITVAILDDHQSIIDGYLFRLGQKPEIEVTATLAFGDDLEPALRTAPVDVLILDINVPTSPENSNPFPILHVIPKLLKMYPQMNILVISMLVERSLIRSVMEAGANGYILKDDRATISELGNVILTVANGGIYFSPKAHQLILNQQMTQDGETLSPRQLEALSLCASHPDALTAEIAQQMSVSNSTVRNLLSGAYIKLGVRTRAAAIARAQNLGMITPTTLSSLTSS
jgi:two-component system, NarL family, nitrate/nitrite response regulator NarL